MTPKGNAPETPSPDFRSIAARVLFVEALTLVVLGVIQLLYRAP